MANNFFIFGAGFTRSVFGNAPLNNELLEALLKRNPHSPLKNLSRSYDSNDIELLLTRLDIDIQQGHNSLELRNSINMEIAKYFEQFRFNPDILMNKKWLKEFACNTFHENDIIINLNYDCFLEGLLDHFDTWNPNGGYGIVENSLVGEGNINRLNIQILKIHGSENFTQQDDSGKPGCTFLSYEFNSHIFPKSAANSHLGALSVDHTPNVFNAKPYIIAPSYVKIPTVRIHYLMLDTIEAMNKSKNVFIVGCGLRREDSFLWLLLTRFLRNRDWQHRKIVLIDPNANYLGDELRKYWGVDIDVSIVEIPSKLEDAINELISRTQ